MTLAENKGLRLFTLCVLYVAQGIPWGFTATTIPAYLGARGLSPEAIGTALVTTTLPYSFKWVWGPIIDAFTGSRFGRRRPWVVFAQLGMAATILAMIAIPDLALDVKLLAWMILVHSTFNALQDVAVDALAIDLLDETERGRANGLMYACKYGGGYIGGMGFAWIIAKSSLETALIVQTAILGAIMLLPLLVRERATEPLPVAVAGRPSAGERMHAAAQRAGAVLRSLAEVFSLRSAIAAAVLVLGLNFAIGVLSTNGFALFTQRLGWSPEDYTSLVGGYGLLAGGVGAAAGGFLADRFGHRRVIATASIVMATGWAVFGALTYLWTNVAFVYAAAIVEAVSNSIMSVGIFALCMKLSSSRAGASQFTAYMAMMNFATTLGYRAAGSLFERFDYAGCYLLVAGIQLAMTSVLLVIDPSETRRKLPLPEGTPTPVRGIIAVSTLFTVLVGFTVYVTLTKLR